MTVQMWIVCVLAGVVVFAAVAGMTVLIAALLSVLQMQVYVSRGGIQMPASDRADEFEAATASGHALSK
jgi:hypothetical protein